MAFTAEEIAGMKALGMSDAAIAELAGFDPAAYQQQQAGILGSIASKDAAALAAAQKSGISNIGYYVNPIGAADIIPGTNASIMERLGIYDPSYQAVMQTYGSENDQSNPLDVTERSTFAIDPRLSYRLVDGSGNVMATANTPEEIAALVAQANQLSKDKGSKAVWSLEKSTIAAGSPNEPIKQGWVSIANDQNSELFDTPMKLILAGMLAMTAAGALQPGGFAGVGGTTGATAAPVATTAATAAPAVATAAPVVATAAPAAADAIVVTATGLGTGIPAAAVAPVVAAPAVVAAATPPPASAPTPAAPNPADIVVTANTTPASITPEFIRDFATAAGVFGPPAALTSGTPVTDAAVSQNVNDAMTTLGYDVETAGSLLPAEYGVGAGTAAGAGAGGLGALTTADWIRLGLAGASTVAGIAEEIANGGGGGGTILPTGGKYDVTPISRVQNLQTPVGAGLGDYGFNPFTYGQFVGDQPGEYLFFSPAEAAAAAGMADGGDVGYAEGGEPSNDVVKHLIEYRKGGGHHGPGAVKGIGSGQDDKIPAWLSDGEYVWSAQDVSDLGDGSNDEGVRRLDKMRQLVRQRAGRKSVKKIAKPQKGIDHLLAAVGGK